VTSVREESQLSVTPSQILQRSRDADDFHNPRTSSPALQRSYLCCLQDVGTCKGEPASGYGTRVRSTTVLETINPDDYDLF
jgi:hypothetical protein